MGSVDDAAMTPSASGDDTTSHASAAAAAAPGSGTAVVVAGAARARFRRAAPADPPAEPVAVPPWPTSRDAALSTRFRGMVFRSRLEARFAVFLEALGVTYWYERMAFCVAARGGDDPPAGGAGPATYRPDFWLPAMRTVLELKPAYPHAEEEARCAQVARLGFRVVLLYGAEIDRPSRSEHDEGGRTYRHRAAMRGMCWEAGGRRLAGDYAFCYHDPRADPATPRPPVAPAPPPSTSAASADVAASAGAVTIEAMHEAGEARYAHPRLLAAMRLAREHRFPPSERR